MVADFPNLYSLRRLERQCKRQRNSHSSVPQGTFRAMGHVLPAKVDLGRQQSTC